jgi:VWFA-related protein
VFQLTRILVVGALVLAQAPATPPPQPPPNQQPQQPPPRFRVETNLVRVDAYATKNGVPVHDLTAADFEILEDNAPQKIESFEHIVVDTGGPQSERAEPSSVTAANALAADPRRRVFIIYLDHNHVSFQGSQAIKQPLIDFMQRVMSDDDLIGVMTPDMSPSQITLGRRTRQIENFLIDNWAWGREGRRLQVEDDRERLYAECFPPIPGTNDDYPSALASALIVRRRERLVLDSLRDLIRHMGAIREGRTAVIAVTDGWVLFAPDPRLTQPRTDVTGRKVDPTPGTLPPVGVGPGGTMTNKLPSPDGSIVSNRTECDKDRAELAMADNDRRFKDLFGEANRANVSFYPIDPRGLVVFDTSIEQNVSLEADRLRRVRRSETLELLALNTDGLALLNSNDLKAQLRRAADDLTSYYLMGYYSTNSKPDGKFRAIKVRSKRPGVEIRARRGYNTATAAEIEAARAATEVVVPEARKALTRALGTIETDVRAQGRQSARVPGDPVVLHRGPSTGNQVQPAPGRVFPRSERLRVELEADAGTPVWTGAVLDRNGTKTAVPVVTGERTDAATGQRWLTADVTLAPLAASDYAIELSIVKGTETLTKLVAIRVTQ